MSDLFRRIKEAFKTEETEEKKEFNSEEDPILNEKWLYVSFMVPVNRTMPFIGDFGDTPTEVVMGFILPTALPLKKKNVTVSEENLNEPSLALMPDKSNPLPPTIQGPFMHVKFVDKREEDLDKEEFETRIISKGEGKNYGFTPKRFIELTEEDVFRIIKTQIVDAFQPEIIPEQVTILGFKDGKPMNTKSDGIFLMQYLIRDRVKLYKADKKLEGRVFSPKLPGFIDWLIDRKEYNEHTKRYCSKVEDILKEHNLQNLL